MWQMIYIFIILYLIIALSIMKYLINKKCDEIQVPRSYFWNFYNSEKDPIILFGLFFPIAIPLYFLKKILIL